MTDEKVLVKGYHSLLKNSHNIKLASPGVFLITAYRGAC